MQIGHSGEHWRTAGAQSMRAQGLVSSGKYLGMIGKTEVVIGAEINDRLRFPTIIDQRASICGRQ